MKHDRDATGSRSRGRRTFLTALAALGASAALPVRSETTGRVLFGYSLTAGPEGVVNAVLRNLQTTYTPNLGPRLLYRLGTGSANAADVVAGAAPDGGTVLLASSAAMTLVPLTAHKAARDDLLPVSGIGDMTYAFIIGPAVPADIKTLSAFLVWATDNPGYARYGVPGRGTAAHFVGSEIVRLSDVPLKSIGYQGMVPLMEDVSAGRMAGGVVGHLGSVDATRYPTIRVLAVSSRKRWPGSDDVETLMESGYAKVPVTTSLGFYVPSLTPDDKVAALRSAIGDAVRDPSIRESMASAGMVPLSRTDDYAALVAAERDGWKQLVEQRHFTIET